MPRHGTRIDTVMHAIRTRIAARSDAPGARLPSVRAQAQAMGLSVSTVVQAYERLVAEGLIMARPGAGFYVAGPAAPLALMELAPPRERDIDPLWVSRQSLEPGEGLLKPGCGWLPADWMYQDGVRRALRTLARADATALADYDTPLGYPGLRQVLARRMAACGVPATPGQVLLTGSGTQSIDLICRLLLQPGDVVLLDEPCYFNFHALLRAHRVRAVGVPYTPQGPDLLAFEAALQAHRPRLYLTNSAVHNPTGAVLAPAVAHRLLRLAEAADMVIVEDDILADFEEQPAPRLAAFDGLGRVLHVGSFSKSVSAALRCGYIAARADWIEALTDLKIATGFGGSALAARTVHQVLTDSGYRRHLQALRLRLARSRHQVIPRLQALGLHPWLVPQAGMFVWCHLPPGLDAAVLARTCLPQGVVLAPGNVFSQAADAGRFMRLNVAQMGDERIFTVLAQALAAHGAAPNSSTK
ncbi:MAG: PLP-dependent aminotransferase family protein [Comamonadaceae bacterium]|nr:PLP-dependent aminotransferase family protein [Comamonadaceae bacterium]